jgi:glycosyltransferase involved in cell wall biosynthesis
MQEIDGSFTVIGDRHHAKAKRAAIPRAQSVEGRTSNAQTSASAAQQERLVRQANVPAIPPGVLYRAIVYGGSGYASSNSGVVLGLARTALPLQLQPVGAQADSKLLLSADAREALERLQGARVKLDESVVLQSSLPSDFDLNLRGRCQVGHTFFETDRLPDSWLYPLDRMDEVWVRTRFNYETFARAGISEKKLHVVPEGVDTALYRPGIQPLAIPQKRKFNFLSVFDWVPRKGFDVLLRAFITEFRADEDVALILKICTITQPWVDAEALLAHFIERELRVSLENTAPIIVLNGLLPEAEMPRLYAAADAFVLPSRGEGWGRPYLEALACECPVIATRWSGHLDFLHSENSYLIEPECIAPVSCPDIELAAGHYWAEPSVDHLRQLMRHVVNHREETRLKAAQGRFEAVRLWDWSVVCELWLKEFQRLLG